jgi:maltooligosyltrehalose trehalohydrolase
MDDLEIHKKRSRWRRLPIGAELLPEGGVHFRVWAPRRSDVKVVLEGGPGWISADTPVITPLVAEDEGYFSGFVSEAGDKTLYRFKCSGDGFR